MGEKSFKQEQIIRYMGNKRAILDKITSVISKVHNSEKAFCDLMAGTAAVSYAVKTLNKNNIKVITNDSESYSYIIQNALIKNNKILKVEITDVAKILPDFYKNFLEIEKKWSNEYILNNQYRSEKNKKKERFLQGPYCLFTFYYSNVYFSLEQCKEIDSIRYAIKKVKDKDLKNVFLTALLYAVSYCSTSYGHFAQPRKITKDVIKLRGKSILSEFISKLKKLHIEVNNKENITYNKDYRKLFKNKKFNNIKEEIGTFYLDPPYSEANYSRFYHILNTLIKYDYPENRFKGLYRDDRSLSDFCKPKKVKKAFEDIIKFAYYNKSNLIISYSNTGLISKEEIKKICRKYYTGKRSVWSEKDIPHLHSTQGNRKKNGVKEIIIVCKYQ